MVIDSIRASALKYERVVILKEKTSDRYLPIWIGPAEANAIAVKLQGLPVPRPLTQDLLCNIISSLNAATSSIIINDLRDDTFYARIILEVQGRQLEIDARPSDALALAIRTNAPIFADESVLNKAGLLINDKTVKSASVDGNTDNKEIVTEGEIEQLSVFADFINNLDLDDFEKHKS